jgi:hypothetical protein
MDLLLFLRSVGSRWGILMTGGIPMAILALWEHWKGQSVSWRGFVVGALFFLLWAAYLAWRDEHGKRMALTQEVQGLRSTRSLARGYISFGSLRDSVNVSNVSFAEAKTEAVIEWQSAFERKYHVSVQVVSGTSPGTLARIVEQTPKMVKIKFIDQMGLPSLAWEFSFIAE